MAKVGVLRYIDFRINDLSYNPVAGLTLSSFTVIFTRNNAACADALTISDLTGGRYTASYTPSAEGHDYLELYNSTYDQRVMDAEQVYLYSLDDLSGEVALPTTVTETFTGGPYTITAANPQTYTVYAFLATDWQSGVRNPAQALASTTITSAGHWTSSFALQAGTYTLAAIAPGNLIIVLNPSLVV